MTKTHFVTPNGLHKDEHYTTAYDFALLAKYAIQNSDFCKIVNTGKYDVDPTNKDSDGYHLENTNKLIHTKESASHSYEYRYANGLKTGDTNYAGRCLVASAQKGDASLVAVLFGDEEADYRFKTAANLFEWGFDNLQTVPANTLGLPTSTTVTVKNCSFDDEYDGSLTVNADLTQVSVSGLKDEIEELKNNVSQVAMHVTLNNGEVTAPVKKGDVVGTAAYQYDGKTLFLVDLTADRDVLEMGQKNTDGSRTNSLVTGDIEQKKPASPWLFWILVLGLIVVVVFCVRAVAARRYTTRRVRRRRGGTHYRGRR